MSMVAERQLEQMGKSKGAENHDHDLIHELSQRREALWRFDQYSVNAKTDERLQAFWHHWKEQAQDNVQQLKQCVANHCAKNCI